MPRNESRPPLLETGNGLGICSATTPCNPEYSAIPRARQARTPAGSTPSIDFDGPAPRVAETALAAVLRARTLRAAHLAARAGLDALAAAAPCDVLEVDEATEISGRTPSTVRRWAARHRLGRRLGGRWLLSRARFRAFVEGNA